MHRKDVEPQIDQIGGQLQGKEDRRRETVVGLAMILVREFAKNAGDNGAGAIIDALCGTTAYDDLRAGKLIPETPPELWGTWEEVKVIAGLIQRWLEADLTFDIGTRKLVQRVA